MGWLSSGKGRDGRCRAAEGAFAYLRHVTNLSLLALGGILTFKGTILADIRNEWGVWLPAFLFLFAGMTALGTQERLARDLLSSRAQLQRFARMGRMSTCSLLLGAGVTTGAMLRFIV